MLVPIHKSQGLNQSEKLLTALGDKVFLRLWCYPNVYFKGNQGAPKELCDLLVVFDKDVIIFQDKDVSFPDSGDLDVDWGRWYRRSVNAGIDQVYGAERTIRSGEYKFYLNPKCEQEFPISLPGKEDIRVHRIVVARGSSNRNKEFNGGSGSLMVSNDPGFNLPFAVGIGDKSKGFVHIFDEVGLGIVLGYLDTVSDLVSYLTKKEEFMGSRKMVTISGEEELLARFATSMDSPNSHGFNFSDKYDGIAITEGAWEKFSTSPELAARVKENEISGLWDFLAEKFIHHLLEGTTLTYTKDPKVSDIETIIRWMGAENRVRRRMLAQSIDEILRTTPPGQRRSRVLMPDGVHPNDPFWVFIILPHPAGISFDKYRKSRQGLMLSYAYVTKLLYPQAVDIVCIGLNALNDKITSEDALYLNVRVWTAEQQARAEAWHNDPNVPILQNSKINKTGVKEFPTSRQ